MFKIFLLSVFALAARTEKAHQHGAAEVTLAFEGNKGKLSMEIPAQAIVGFEHKAETAADKKAQQEALHKVENKISDMFVFEKSLKCQFKKESLQLHQEGNHGDVEAEFLLQCEKNPQGSVMIVNISSVFPQIHVVKINILTESTQKSVEIKNAGARIEFKQ